MGGVFAKLGQPVSLTMLGLDNSGKSTILYRLKHDEYFENLPPTPGFNCEEIKGEFGRAKGVSFKIWDVAGGHKVRALWSTYARSTDGIVFVVDSVEASRMDEAKTALSKIAKNTNTRGVPILVVANKQDLPGAIEPDEVKSMMGLNELADRRTRVCGANAKTGEGLDEALESLYQMIIQNRQNK